MKIAVMNGMEGEIALSACRLDGNFRKTFSMNTYAYCLSDKPGVDNGKLYSGAF